MESLIRRILIGTGPIGLTASFRRCLATHNQQRYTHTSTTPYAAGFTTLVAAA